MYMYVFSTCSSEYRNLLVMPTHKPPTCSLQSLYTLHKIILHITVRAATENLDNCLTLFAVKKSLYLRILNRFD